MGPTQPETSVIIIVVPVIVQLTAPGAHLQIGCPLQLQTNAPLDDPPEEDDIPDDPPDDDPELLHGFTRKLTGIHCIEGILQID